MRAIASVLVLVVLGGCNLRQQVAAGGLAVTVVGLGLTYSGSARQESSTANDVGIGMMLVGLVTLFTAAALEETAAQERPKEIRVTRRRPSPFEAPSTATRRPREEAWQHTKEAQAAARAGDCARVTELSAKVGALDPELFADVFMADVAIQACFTAPSAPAATPPTEPAPATTPVDVPGVPVPLPVPVPAEPAAAAP